MAVALTLLPLPALGFDQDEFCTAVTDIARRMSARTGRWLDRSTRHVWGVADLTSRRPSNGRASWLPVGMAVRVGVTLRPSRVSVSCWFER